MQRLGSIVPTAIMLAALALCGCQDEAPRVQQEGPIHAGTIVGSVGKQYVTVQEIMFEWYQMTAPGYGVAPSKENAWKEIVLRKAAFESIDDYDDYDPAEIHRLAKGRLHDLLMTYMWSELITPRVNVSDAQIDSFYNANIAQFTNAALRWVTHLLISENPKAWEAAGFAAGTWDKATLATKSKQAIDDYYAQVKGGADLAELASAYSHDTSSKARRGSSGWFRREEMVDEFSNQAFSLAVGALSRPFRSIYGWHILRVDSAVSESITPLDSSLRQQIRAQLQREEETRLGSIFVDSVFKLAKYEWNEDILNRKVGDYDTHDWVGIVNGTDTMEAGFLRELEMMVRTGRRVDSVSADDRRNLLISRSSPFVLSSVARQLGYFDRDTMRTAMANFRRNELVGRRFRDRVPGDLKFTEEQLEEYYKKHESDFRSDKPIKIEQIVIADSGQAMEAWRDIRSGTDFNEVAMKYYPGEQDLKQAAFELGWISRNDIDPDLYDRAWLMPVGQVSDPIKTPWGYHFVRVVDRKLQTDFAGAKNEVRRRMRDEAYREAREKFEASVLKGVKVVRYDDVYNQLELEQRERYQAISDSIQNARAAGAN